MPSDSVDHAAHKWHNWIYLENGMNLVQLNRYAQCAMGIFAYSSSVEKQLQIIIVRRFIVGTLNYIISMKSIFKQNRKKPQHKIHFHNYT